MNLQTIAIDHNLNWPYDDSLVFLVVRCTPSENEVFIYWDKYMTGDDDTFDSKLRWDNGQPVDAKWNESTSNEATFLQGNDTDFVRQAEQTDTLFVRIWDFSYEAHDAEFDLRGLSVILDENAESCR